MQKIVSIESQCIIFPYSLCVVVSVSCVLKKRKIGMTLCTGLLCIAFWRWRKFSVWTIFTKDFKVFFCLRTIRFFVTANIDVVQFYQKTLFRDIWFGSFEYLHLFTYFLMIVSELLSLCAMCMWDTVLHRYSTFSECNDSLRFFIWKFSTFESVSFLSAWDFDAYKIPCKNSETDCSTKTIIGHWKLFVSWEKLGFPRRCSTFLWNARKYPKNQWNEVITYPKKEGIKTKFVDSVNIKKEEHAIQQVIAWLYGMNKE